MCLERSMRKDKPDIAILIILVRTFVKVKNVRHTSLHMSS
jgi:hypothetical protein